MTQTLRHQTADHHGDARPAARHPLMNLVSGHAPVPGKKARHEPGKEHPDLPAEREIDEDSVTGEVERPLPPSEKPEAC